MSTIVADPHFHVGLNIADLDRSVRFYRTLLGAEPVKVMDDYGRFELAEPPLVLALIPAPQVSCGTLNHMGLRYPDSDALVAVQRRLEEAGIATQRQEGVECCYARQTKFWVNDPDGNLWEIYTLHEDIDHSGFVDPPTRPVPEAQRPKTIWQHRLTDPVPERIAAESGTVDEIWLEGTFNAVLPDGALTRLLTESRRVLRDTGKIVVHGLVANRAVGAMPRLPGLASMVQRIPVETEPATALEQAGFTDLYFEKLADIHCFEVEGVTLREIRLSACKQADTKGPSHEVLYKGPLRQVRSDDGALYARGQIVSVTGAVWQRLRQGPAANQFAFLNSFPG